MATGDTLAVFDAMSNNAPDWLWVAFTSGSVEPTPGDVIWGDTSNANAILEYLGPLTSGTWGGGDAAGWMLLSTWNAVAWTSGENFTKNSTTPANEGTLTTVPAGCFATLDLINNIPVLDFDDTVNEVSMFIGVLASNYDGGGLTVTLTLAGAAATGDMSFAGLFRSFTDDVDNLLATAFNTWGTRQGNAAIDAPSVIGELTYDDITFASGAEMDSLAAGEMFAFLIFRDAQDGTNDDMSGDGSLVTIEIKET